MSLTAKEESLSAFSDPCVFFPLAADPAELETRFGETSQLRKNSHQGFERKNPALHQGSAWTNSGTALGIEPLLRLEGVRSRCTGKEHDSESGLDNFGARYDSSQYGRFMTPDWSGKPQGVPYAQFGDPQSLNLYAYVENNPIGKADADGHCSLCDFFTTFLNTITGADTPPPPPPPPPVPSGVMTMLTPMPAPQSQHLEHTAELGGTVFNDNGDGFSGKADVIYATAKNTSGKGDLSGEVGIGGAKTEINSDGGNTKGQDTFQMFTADANGKIGAKGIGLGANARVFEGTGQLSFKVGHENVAVKGTFSVVGVGANGHITWTNGFSAGGGVILGALGAGLSVNIRHNGDD